MSNVSIQIRFYAHTVMTMTAVFFLVMTLWLDLLDARMRYSDCRIVQCR